MTVYNNDNSKKFKFSYNLHVGSGLKFYSNSAIQEFFFTHAIYQTMKYIYIYMHFEIDFSGNLTEYNAHKYANKNTWLCMHALRGLLSFDFVFIRFAVLTESTCNLIYCRQADCKGKWCARCQDVHETRPCTIQKIIWFKKNENFHWKKFDIFLIFAKNIDCGYTLDPLRRGGSNEYPRSMFWSKNKKNRYTPAYPSFFYIKLGFRGGILHTDMFL